MSENIFKYGRPSALIFADPDSVPREVGADYALPVREADSVPRIAVAPEVDGSPKAFQEFGDGTVEVLGLRYTVNPGDDVVASVRLLNGYPDCGFLSFDAQVAIASDVAITSLYVVAVGNTTAGTPATGRPIGVVGGPGTDATEEQTRTSMVEFNFGAEDSVRTIILTTTPSYTSAAVNPTADNFVAVTVEGRSYA